MARETAAFSDHISREHVSTGHGHTFIIGLRVANIHALHHVHQCGIRDQHFLTCNLGNDDIVRVGACIRIPEDKEASGPNPCAPPSNRLCLDVNLLSCRGPWLAAGLLLHMREVRGMKMQAWEGHQGEGEQKK